MPEELDELDNLTTHFLTFWRALNNERRSLGYEQIPYGIARDTWRTALDYARKEMFERHIRAA